jgi:hypothetical protein
MSAEKADVRASAAHEIGTHLEEMLESSKANQVRCDAAHSTLRRAADDIEGLLAHVDKDVDEGTFDVTTAGHVKAYLLKAKAKVDEMTYNAFTKRIEAAGQVIAMTRAVETTKKFFDFETAKAARVREYLAQQAEGVADPRRRPTGVMPPQSSFRRKKADEPVSEAQTIEPTGEPEVAEVMEPEVAAEVEAPPTRTRRKRNAENT